MEKTVRMKIIQKPIKEIIIYELRKRTLNDFKHNLVGTSIPWCKGYLIITEEIPDSELKSRELIDNQTIHIRELNYYKLSEFPKEPFKNEWGREVKLANASHIEFYVQLRNYIVLNLEKTIGVDCK